MTGSKEGTEALGRSGCECVSETAEMEPEECGEDAAGGMGLREENERRGLELEGDVRGRAGRDWWEEMR